MDRREKELLRIMEDSSQPAKERVSAGNELAILGDPRLEVMTTEHMQFCRIPEGEFLMGEKLEKVNLPEFFISRYPITNAQFVEFVNTKGYQQKSYWPEASFGYWSAAGFKGDRDGEHRSAQVDYGKPFNLSNHPVVGVSWYEAQAFSRWLDELFKKIGGILVFGEQGKWKLSKGYWAGLPDDTQWEKAARGTDGREYPWEGNFNPDKANTEETGIGATSAVGCFPDGASPYGVLEMSGNVFEWTDTWRDEYMDQKVQRGGSFDGSRGGSRCAFRGGNVPDYNSQRCGFRVVVSLMLQS